MSGRMLCFPIRGQTYLELLRQLKQLTNKAVPADINIDFEAGMIGALDKCTRYTPHMDVCGGQRFPPIFPHVLWNVNSHVPNNLP